MNDRRRPLTERADQVGWDARIEGDRHYGIEFAFEVSEFCSMTYLFLNDTVGSPRLLTAFDDLAGIGDVIRSASGSFDIRATDLRTARDVVPQQVGHPGHQVAKQRLAAFLFVW